MRDALTGTGLLTRLGMRRDRWRLPIWTIATAAFVPLFFGSLESTMSDFIDAPEALAEIRPMLAVFAGPVYGIEGGRLQSYFFMYQQEFVLAAGIMTILIVLRHTRGEEQTGRAELMRGAVIGRHAPLASALSIAAIGNGILAALLSLAGLTIGLGTHASIVFGVSTAATGLFFGAVTAITAQIAGTTRTAGGIAGIVLAASSLLRGTLAVSGNENPALWLSPMAWPNLTRPVTDPTWWPVVLTFVAAALLAGIGCALSTRRDVGAAMTAPRPGPSHASRTLRGPVSLVWRLLRGSFLWWTIALAALGLVWGTMSSTMDVAGANSLFGEGDLVRNYLSTIAVTLGFLVSVFALTSVGRMRAEETSGRLEGALGTSTSRPAWIGAWLSVTAGSSALMLLATGLAVGLGSSAANADPSLLPDMIGALAQRLPEVLVILAFSGALYALWPKWQRLAWIPLAISMIVQYFGAVLGMPALLTALSVTQHMPALPVEDFALTPLLVVCSLAAVLTSIAIWAFSRRTVPSV